MPRAARVAVLPVRPTEICLCPGGARLGLAGWAPRGVSRGQAAHKVGGGLEGEPRLSGSGRISECSRVTSQPGSGAAAAVQLASSRVATSAPASSRPAFRARGKWRAACALAGSSEGPSPASPPPPGAPARPERALY